MIRLGRSDETEDHNYVKDRLCAYLDDELTARERRAVEQHLKTCETCRWDLATLKQTVAWLKELPTVPIPRVFSIPANVVPAPPVRRPRWSFVPAMQFATALVAVLLFFAAAGDVMLTGWPWGTTAQPDMLQEVAVEQAPVDVAVAKQAEATTAPAVEAYAAPYGTQDAAATVPVEEEAEAVGAAAAPEEAMTLQQAEPAAESRAMAPTEAPAGMGGGEATAVREETAEGAVGVETDAGPGQPTAAAPAAALVETPVTEPTAPPAPPSAATEAPMVALAPAPTAMPTIVPSATEAVQAAAELVQAPEPLAAEQMLDAAESPAPATAETDWAVFWLRAVEYVLGVALVVLAGATIVLMVWRRRASGR